MCSMTSLLIAVCCVEPPFVHGERCQNCRVAISCACQQHLQTFCNKATISICGRQHLNGSSSMQPQDKVGTFNMLGCVKTAWYIGRATRSPRSACA